LNIQKSKRFENKFIKTQEECPL